VAFLPFHWFLHSNGDILLKDGTFPWPLSCITSSGAEETRPHNHLPGASFFYLSFAYRPFPKRTSRAATAVLAFPPLLFCVLLVFSCRPSPLTIPLVFPHSTPTLASRRLRSFPSGSFSPPSTIPSLVCDDFPFFSFFRWTKAERPLSDRGSGCFYVSSSFFPFFLLQLKEQYVKHKKVFPVIQGPWHWISLGRRKLKILNFFHLDAAGPQLLFLHQTPPHNFTPLLQPSRFFLPPNHVPGDFLDLSLPF